MEQRLTQPVTEPARGLRQSVEPAKADWPSQSWSRRCTRQHAVERDWHSHLRRHRNLSGVEDPARCWRLGREGWSSVAARAGPAGAPGRGVVFIHLRGVGGRPRGRPGASGSAAAARRAGLRAGGSRGRRGGRWGASGLALHERRGCRGGAGRFSLSFQALAKANCSPMRA